MSENDPYFCFNFMSKSVRLKRDNMRRTISLKSNYVRTDQSRSVWREVHLNRLLFSLVLCLATSPCALSQGWVSFHNFDVYATEDPTGGKRLVYDFGSPLDPVSGAKFAGTQYVAELYVGTNASALSPVTASISRFRSTTSINRGKWGATTIDGYVNNRIVLPYPPGSTVTLMVKVWDYTHFQNFEEAETAGDKTGASAPFTYFIPDPNAPPEAFYMEGLQAFSSGATSPCTPHRAQASAQLVEGTVGGVSVTDPGCGYANPPVVVIKGGGGTGAAATAVVSNRQVIAINVTNPGCCYTNPPQVLIAPLWFRPAVSIRSSRVKVEQQVLPGHRYVLEASFDNTTWTATGPPFIAPAEVVANEFDVGTVGSFFRLQEVP